MYVNIDRQIVANLRIILYKECNTCDVGLLCFLQLVDNKFAASCQQPRCKFIVKIFYINCFNNFQQVSKRQTALSMVLTDLMQTVYEAHRQQA